MQGEISRASIDGNPPKSGNVSIASEIRYAEESEDEKSEDIVRIMMKKGRRYRVDKQSTKRVAGPPLAEVRFHCEDWTQELSF